MHESANPVSLLLTTANMCRRPHCYRWVFWAWSQQAMTHTHNTFREPKSSTLAV
jgi:hypothetical protein